MAVSMRSQRHRRRTRPACDRQLPTPPADRRTEVTTIGRVEAAGAIAAAAGAATATAWIDAASISVRLDGQAIAARPAWMAGFGVAAFTVTLGAWVLTNHGGLSRLTSALCVLLATANVAVAMIEVLGPRSSLLLPAVHLIAGAALAAILLPGARRNAPSSG